MAGEIRRANAQAVLLDIAKYDIDKSIYQHEINYDFISQFQINVYQ